MIKLFLSPRGRSTRREFWIGVAAFFAFMIGFHFALPLMVESMWGFFATLFGVVLFFQIIYAVYGKRLHDMGRSFWPLTWAIVLIFLIGIVVMLSQGGAEMMSEFSQYDRKEDIPEAESARILAEYQANMANAEKLYSYAIYVIWGVLTLWLGLSKGQAEANSYGPARDLG